MGLGLDSEAIRSLSLYFAREPEKLNDSDYADINALVANAMELKDDCIIAKVRFNLKFLVVTI